MEGGCDEQFCSERKEGYIYQKHHWRLPLLTACGNPFPQVVTKVVAHPFPYTAGPKVKPPVKKEDRRLRALFSTSGLASTEASQLPLE
jgi:hypothetical protein